MATNPSSLTDTSAFADLTNLAEQSQNRESLYDSVAQQHDDAEYTAPGTPALASTTLLTALARTDPSKDIELQLGQQNLEAARTLLESGQERQVRNEIAINRIQRDAAGVGKLARGVIPNVDPETVNMAESAYNNVLRADYDKRARTAIEEEAVDKIQSMAARNPTQAKVLLDLFEKGDANQRIKDFNVKMSILHQRAEELDQEYQQSGWGRSVLNFVLNLIPTNYNFARTGIVGTAGLGGLLAVGEQQRRESEQLWNMPMEDFAEYTKKDGELMQSIRDNATTAFDLTADPKAAVEVMDSLTAQTDHSRKWNDVWGGAEVASLIPWTKVGSATRTLLGSGAADAAARNLDNAIRVMDESGVEAMTRSTGVTEGELADELSVGAINPHSPSDVPMSEQVATRRDAANQALDQLFSPPEGNRFRTPEELKAAFDSTVADISAQIGRPIKDVTIIREPLPGGQHVFKIEYTYGRKDGHGFATERSAVQAYKNSGFGTEVVETIETKGPLPIAEPKSTVELLGEAGGRNGAEKAYKFKVTGEHGDEANISLIMYPGGRGNVAVQGLSPNAFGPAEIRSITAKLADMVPDLKTIDGLRTTGARQAAGTEAEAAINVESLRGRIATTMRDASGQWFVKGTRAMPETGFFTDELHPLNEGFLSKLLGRYVRAAPRVSDANLHGAAIESGEYMNRAHKVIRGNIMSTFGKLPKDSRNTVKLIALKGSEQGRWFKPEEFDHLVERLTGRRATDAERDGYQKIQLYNDMDWELRNTAAYLDKVTRGHESVEFTMPWGEPHDLDVKIDYGLDKIPVDRVYDASLNRHFVHGRNPLTSETLKNLKDNGYVMMEVPDGVVIPDGRTGGTIRVNKVLIKKGDVKIRELRREQLNYSEGGHRMYADNVFVKQGRQGVQSDTGSKYLLAPNTFRTAKNIAEGKKWAAKMNEVRLALKDNPNLSEVEIDEMLGHDPAFNTGREIVDAVHDGTISLEHPFEAVWDRDLPSLYNKNGVDISRMYNEDELGMTGYFRTTGRMYLSPKGEILQDTSGKVAEILDPYDTLTRSLQQVTRNLGLFNYKAQALDRFRNTYGEYLDIPANGMSPSKVLTDAKVLPDIPLELRNRIEAQRAAILNVLRYETPLDKTQRQLWQSAAEKILGDGDSIARKFAHDAVWWWKEKNPLATMRGLAFDMKLGVWNPGQLLVQASTMISATALSPKYGLKGMAGLFPMHAYLLKRGSEGVLDAMAKRGVGKIMGFETEQEFKDYARHLYNHGFADMNGSHIMINDYGPAAHFGTFKNKFDVAREHSRVFFYTAETWNRLVAYRIAWGEAKDMGKAVNDLDFTSTIMRLADDYSMNMTGESASFWQKGLLSIPTQFWAYNVRMMDAMFGKRFTPAQRIRLAFTHAALMGTAGIPILPAVTEYVKEKYGHAPDIDTLQGTLDRGLIDYFNYEMTGNDILISERIGTGGWAGQTVRTLFGDSAYGETSFADLVGGATYSIAKSTGKTMYDFARYAAAESGSDMGDAGLKQEGFLRMLNQISTFSNVTKAMLLHQYGMYKSNNGTILASGLPESNAVYAALSFRPAKAQEIQYLMAWEKDQKESTQEIAKQLRNWRQEAINNPDLMEENMKKSNALVRLLPPSQRTQAIQQANRTMDPSFYDHIERKVLEEQAQLDEGNQQ